MVWSRTLSGLGEIGRRLGDFAVGGYTPIATHAYKEVKTWM